MINKIFGYFYYRWAKSLPLNKPSTPGFWNDGGIVAYASLKNDGSLPMNDEIQKWLNSFEIENNAKVLSHF